MMVTEEGGAGAAQLFFFNFMQFCNGSSLTHPTQQDDSSAGHQSPPSWKVCSTFCYYLPLAEGGMSHFPPPHKAMALISLLHIICSLSLKEVQVKIIFPSDILIPQMGWSFGKLYSGFLRTLVNQMGSPLVSMISLLFSTLPVPYLSPPHILINLIP